MGPPLATGEAWADRGCRALVLGVQQMGVAGTVHGARDQACPAWPPLVAVVVSERHDAGLYHCAIRTDCNTWYVLRTCVAAVAQRSVAHGTSYSVHASVPHTALLGQSGCLASGDETKPTRWWADTHGRRDRHGTWFWCMQATVQHYH